MKIPLRVALLGVAAVLACLPAAAAEGQFDMPQRQELRRADLTGAPGMVVITSISEYHKGDQVPRHLHHGVETGYVVQGSWIQVPGKDPVKMETGSPIMNLRDAVHGGFTVVGDEPLKLLTVHIVDHDQPLYDWQK